MKLLNLFNRKIFLNLNYNFLLASHRKNVKVIKFKFFEHYFILKRVKIICNKDVAFSQQIDANVGLARLTQRG